MEFSYRTWLHEQPDVKVARSRMADAYRVMRRSNPGMTRLVFRRAEVAKKLLRAEIAEKFYSDRGGISSLFAALVKS